MLKKGTPISQEAASHPILTFTPNGNIQSISIESPVANNEVLTGRGDGNFGDHIREAFQYTQNRVIHIQSILIPIHFRQ